MLKGHYARVIFDLNYFGMSCLSGAHVSIGRVAGGPALVAYGRIYDAFDLAELILNPPESAGTKIGDFHVFCFSFVSRPSTAGAGCCPDDQKQSD